MEDTGYTLTDKGQTALAEAYWRAKIAEELRKKVMPVCVCERCGNLQEGAIIERCIEAVLGRVR